MAVTFTIKISDELNTWLDELAKQEYRSKNSQINFLLEMTKDAYDDDNYDDGFILETGKR